MKIYLNKNYYYINVGINIFRYLLNNIILYIMKYIEFNLLLSVGIFSMISVNKFLSFNRRAIISAEKNDKIEIF